MAAVRNRTAAIVLVTELSMLGCVCIIQTDVECMADIIE